MEIILKKGLLRNTLTCKRKNGSFTSANLGRDIPNHDIAHYVVERYFKIQGGFFGTIKSGKTIAELSDPEEIKNLGPETWLSEIMARNLQAIGSGTASIEQYSDLIRWEVTSMKGIQIPTINLTDIEEMKSDFKMLCKKWDALLENEELNLIFD